MTIRLLRLSALALLPYCLAAHFGMSLLHAQTASIAGHVWDYTPDAMGKYNGIPAVFAVAKVGGAVHEAVGKTTDAAGEYLIKDVPIGKTQIEFRRDGYINDPTTVEIELASGMAAVVDAYLMPGDPQDPDYYGRLANKMWAAAAASDDATASFRAEWDKLYGFGVGPAAKVQLSKALRGNAAVAAAVPVIADYQLLDPAQLQFVQEQFASAKLDPTKLPRPEGVRGVPKPIAADVFISLVQKRDFSEERRAAYIDVFSKSWGSDYGEIVKEKSAPKVMIHRNLNGKSSLKFERPREALPPR